MGGSRKKEGNRGFWILSMNPLRFDAQKFLVDFDRFDILLCFQPVESLNFLNMKFSQRHSSTVLDIYCTSCYARPIPKQT